MTLEEQLEVLRQNGWRWRRLEDEWFEIEAPPEYAGEQFSIGSMLATSQSYHSPFLCDLPLIAGDSPGTMAGHLVDYTARHNLSEAELAEHLGCSVESLREVAYSPVPQTATMEADLERTAGETGCNTTGLQRVIDEQKRPPMQWLFEGGEP